MNQNMKSILTRLLLLSLLILCPIAKAQPITVPKAALPKHTRIMCPVNLSPTWVRNYSWVDDGKGTSPDKHGNPIWQRDFETHDFMVSVGYDECVFLDTSTLNYSKMYAHTDQVSGQIVLEDVPVGGLDWSRASGGLRPDGKIVPIFDDPIDVEALRIVAATTMNPGRYGNKTAHRGLPIIFDLENWYSWDANAKGNTITATDTEEERAKPLRALSQAAATLHTCTDSEVWNYSDAWMLPRIVPETAMLKNELDKYYEQFAGITIGCYLLDWDAQNPARWRSEIGILDNRVRRWSPNNYLNKVVVVNPTWQIYWAPAQRPWVAPLINKVIPMGIWCRMIDELVDEGYMIVLWPGNIPLNDETKARILYLAQYRGI